MSVALPMWSRPTFEVLPNVISSQASLFGPMPSDSPDGPTINPSGRGAAPAQVSPARAKEQGLMTLVTSGRNFIGSPASAALQSSLENSLRTRLDTAGGTLYRLIWKVRHTPLRRRFLVRRALEVQTSAIDCSLSGWPTPCAADSDAGPRVPDAKRGPAPGLNMATKLAGWSTPSARDWKDTEGMATTGTNPDGSERERLDQLGRQVQLAGWPTPTATDAIKQGEVSPRKGCMGLSEMISKLRITPSPMRLKASGEMLTGSSAQMDGGGPLRPEHSRWIQGFPSVWDDCAVTAIASMRKLRKPSSKRHSEVKHDFSGK